MATVNQFLGNFQQQLVLFNRRLAAFFTFLGMKLRNFSSLTVQEQISFGLIGVGLILIATSIVLFLV